MKIDNHPLSDSIKLFRKYKSLTERSIAQLQSEQIHNPIQPGLSSIAILMKHIAGNQISRWINFRTEDGEKDWRDRESEFVNDFNNDDELLAYWEKGWSTLFEALYSIQTDELKNFIQIRYEDYTILNAVETHLAHISYHTGQIILIAKFYTGDSWTSLSIPPGKTEEYNQKKYEQMNSKRSNDTPDRKDS